MEQKYQIFYPGVYSDTEKQKLDAFMSRVNDSGGVGPTVDRTVKAEMRDMLDYARVWDPYNPLYNDPGYAAGSRWGRLPSLPCFPYFENISGFPMLDEVGDDLGNVFYYANDGGEIELFRPVFPGDELRFRSGCQKIIDTTDPNGSALRTFELYGEADMLDAEGNVIGHGTGHGRNAMKRILEGYVPSEYEQTYEWVDNIPPVHITTDEEWKLIEDLWRGEIIRGSEPRWWEDVNIGDELTPVCSGPVSDLEMIRMHGEMIINSPSTRDQILSGEILMSDSYGQKLPFLSRHYSYCRNNKARAVFYNFTARNFILRMLTNWIGDDGFLCSFHWRFQNLFACMSENQPGKEFLAKVPSMAGKFVNRHGMEGDTAICRGEVTGKFVRDGRHIAEFVCWAETLDGDVIQVVKAQAELPYGKKV